jgi:hypothetical protein
MAQGRIKEGHSGDRRGRCCQETGKQRRAIVTRLTPRRQGAEALFVLTSRPAPPRSGGSGGTEPFRPKRQKVKWRFDLEGSVPRTRPGFAGPADHDACAQESDRRHAVRTPSLARLAVEARFRQMEARGAMGRANTDLTPRRQGAEAKAEWIAIPPPIIL